MSGLSFVSNLKITTRMILGTGMILVLLLIVAGVAFFGLGGAVDEFAAYRSLARQTAAMGVIEGEALTTRLGFRNFMIEQSDESADVVFASAKQAIENSEAALDLFQTEESRQQIGVVTEQLKLYQATFGQVRELQEQRTAVVQRLSDLGPEIEKNLTAIMEGANRDGDATAAYRAGDALRSVMLARLYNQKFLTENSQEHADRVRRELADADDGLTRLLAELQDPQRRQQATQAAASVKDYGISFGQVMTLIGQRNELIKGTMDKIGPQVAAALDAMTDESKVRQDEIGPRATAAMETALWMALIIAAIALVVGVSVAFLLSVSITRPVRGMTQAMQKLADGDKAVEIPATDRKDEIGLMAKAVLVFKENMIKAEALAKQEAEAQKQREVRARAIEKLTGDFDQDVAAVLKTVSSSASEMQTTAGSLTATAEETSRQSTAVAAASEQASTNVQTVASAAEELSSSIAEISRQVAQSAEIAGRAVADAERTNVQVQGLAEAAQKIGEVVNLINDIASQTNLLALNATIEAARAGDAGKGFAVVASEVKNLANETAKATEEITAQITGVQAATREAVTAIQAIGQTIGQINEIATTIASAVEEQGAATQEIARNVQQAAAGTSEVSSNIAGVTQAAGETGSAASQMLSASGELAEQGEHLRGEVEKFLQAVRAA